MPGICPVPTAPPPYQYAPAYGRACSKHTFSFVFMSPDPVFSMNSQNDESELVSHLEYFSDRLLRVFSHFFFVVEFHEDKDFLHPPSRENSRAIMLHVMGDACLNETLMALRDLNDFLIPRECPSRKSKAKANDLLASDFGCLEKKTFLSETERTDINQLVAHTTKRGPEVYQYPWDVWELASKCIAQCSSFLQWIEQQYSTHFLLFTAALNCRATTQKIYNALESQRRER